MADTKISALPSATTPLAGTELLPIVQGGATTKVAASAFQAPLVSGTNIKTINGNSLLGSGDLAISGGSGSPGGSTTQVQFNDAGVFGGDAGLAFDKTTGKLTVGGKTVTASAPVLDLSQSWGNNLITFTGIKFNVTDTASAAGSLLMDLQVGGVSKFKVDKIGNVTIGGNLTLGGYIDFLIINNSINLSGSQYFGLGGSGSIINANGSFGWGSSSFVNANTARDLALYRDLANTLAQRNGVNAQTSRLYGTYTDASNYRRLTNTMSAAGVAEIKPEGAGTGATGNVLYISGLPTSNPGPGILWNNGGVVNVGT